LERKFLHGDWNSDLIAEMKNEYPTYVVRNHWNGLLEMSQFFPVSHKGLEAAIEYADAFNIGYVLYIKTEDAEPEAIWVKEGFDLVERGMVFVKQSTINRLIEKLKLDLESFKKIQLDD